MKKNTAPTGKRPFARFALAALLTAGAFTAKAQTPPAEITYAGTANNQLLFVVGLENEAQQPFTLEIRDHEGYVFYTNRFADKTFRKIFALDKSDLDRGAITIQVRTKAGVQTQTFDVNTKTVDEVSVVKL